MITATTTTLPTRNQDYGFFGTCRTSGIPPHEAWNAMMRQLTGMQRCSAEACRLFLDSRDGRHLADELMNQGALTDLDGAIFRALTQHLKWQRRGDNYLFSLLADYEAEATKEAALETAILHAKAYALGLQYLQMDLEIRSAFKQAGSDCGIPCGEQMGAFVAYAEKQLGV